MSVNGMVTQRAKEVSGFAEPKGETETQRHIKPQAGHTDTTQGLGRAGVL